MQKIVLVNEDRVEWIQKIHRIMRMTSILGLQI